MLTLATMFYTAYMYAASATNMRHNVPPPVVIETGQLYDYKPIESAIYVPSSWHGSCEDQKSLIIEMLYHFNNYRNGNNKMKELTMGNITDKWKCLDDN